MRARSLAILIALSTAIPAAAAAKEAPQSNSAALAQQLKTALNAMVQPFASPPGQANRKVDPDQGDDHASARAIQIVCSKDTPAAQRSAICPVPISPE